MAIFAPTLRVTRTLGAAMTDDACGHTYVWNGDITQCWAPANHDSDCETLHRLKRGPVADTNAERYGGAG